MTGGHRARRPEGALLAGVCAGLAQHLGWNVWALRALAVLGLFIHAAGTVIGYLLAAVLLHGLSLRRADDPDRLTAPELRSRSQRIEELERRFRELEEDDPGIRKG